MLFRLKGNWPLSGQTLKLGKSTYLNVATAQVTDNPAMADGSSIHQEAKQQLHSYLRSDIQPLMQTEKLEYTVYVDAFYMDKCEVTNAQYRKFVQATGHREPKYWDKSRFN